MLFEAIGGVVVEAVVVTEVDVEVAVLTDVLAEVVTITLVATEAVVEAVVAEGLSLVHISATHWAHGRAA